MNTLSPFTRALPGPRWSLAGRRLGGRLLLCLALVATFGSGSAALRAGETLEAKVKAVVLTKVLLFVDLGRPRQSDDELVIALLGKSDLEPHLVAALEGFGTRHRKLRIEKARSLETVPHADVIFVPATESVDRCALIRLARRERALTITDQDLVSRPGIMIGLVRQGNRVAIEIDNQEAQRAGVRISSKLLHLAHVVAPPLECY